VAEVSARSTPMRVTPTCIYSKQHPGDDS
jgi:hypothetical protein